MNAIRFDAARIASRSLVGARLPTPEYRYVCTSLATFRVRIAGRGADTIVMSADPPNVIEHTDALVTELAPHVRVVCFEMPGFGFSRVHRDFRFTLDEMTVAVRELLEQLAIGPYTLALPCIAGLVAMRLAVDSPALVRRLVTVQTGTWAQEVAWARNADPFGVVATPYAGQALIAAGRRAFARMWYRSALASANDVDAYTRLALDAYRDGAMYPLASVFQQLRTTNPPITSPPRIPTLVVWGAADRTHARTDRRTLLRELPHAHSCEFPHSGHFPDLESPRAFAEGVRAFIAEATPTMIRTSAVTHPADRA